eukprot:GHVN01054062.1.p1 GENE.GHVN01054062.1~~GHVN01054062.1.p1  ORF type:complete len:739 (-),score=97.78 GHVN01054062.1:124-2340(-)
MFIPGEPQKFYLPKRVNGPQSYPRLRNPKRRDADLDSRPAKDNGTPPVDFGSGGGAPYSTVPPSSFGDFIDPAFFQRRCERSSISSERDPEWSTPGGRSAESPVVVYCQPNAGFYEQSVYCSDWLRFYLSRKVSVMLFNYRGFGRSTGWPCPQSCIADGQAVIDYVKSNFGFKRIGVHGQSIGGICAISMAANNSDVKWLCADRTFSSLQNTATHMLGRWASIALGTTKYGMGENVTGFVDARAYKVMCCDGRDEIIHDMASLKTGVAMRVVELSNEPLDTDVRSASTTYRTKGNQGRNYQTLSGDDGQVDQSDAAFTQQSTPHSSVPVSIVAEIGDELIEDAAIAWELADALAKCLNEAHGDEGALNTINKKLVTFTKAGGVNTKSAGPTAIDEGTLHSTPTEVSPAARPSVSSSCRAAAEEVRRRGLKTTVILNEQSMKTAVPPEVVVPLCGYLHLFKRLNAAGVSFDVTLNGVSPSQKSIALRAFLCNLQVWGSATDDDFQPQLMEAGMKQSVLIETATGCPNTASDLANRMRSESLEFVSKMKSAASKLIHQLRSSIRTSISLRADTARDARFTSTSSTRHPPASTIGVEGSQSHDPTIFSHQGEVELQTSRLSPSFEGVQGAARIGGVERSMNGNASSPGNEDLRAILLLSLLHDAVDALHTFIMALDRGRRALGVSERAGNGDARIALPRYKDPRVTGFLVPLECGHNGELLETERLHLAHHLAISGFLNSV